jgi:mannose-6-phosphate isomerase-like protein (cupin superfamily)
VGTRRIVTGLSPTGRAVVVSDGFSPWSEEALHVPGLRTELLWQTANPPCLPPAVDGDPVNGATTLLPKPGRTSIQVVTFPPDASLEAAGGTEAELGSDLAKVFPGLAELFERENPGMHVTDTVDYCVLLEGELLMELDDGVSTVVRQHDVVVQNGTRHGWRNRSSQPATMLFVMFGAAR